MGKNLSLNEDKSTLSNSISIVVIGYDGYKDVWNNFVHFINKYWKDRPKTYLATSELEPDYYNIEIIKAGVSSEWSNKARNALKKIKTKYVLLLLEDFFIVDYVDNNKLNEILDFIIKYGIKFYQLSSMSFTKYLIFEKKLSGYNYVHIIPKSKKYGLNLQAAIWDKDYLLEIIGEGNYNTWEFECNNIYIKNYDENKISYVIDDRNVLNILHSVLQSKYLPSAIYKCRKIGYNLNNSNRKVMSVWDELKFRFKSLMGRLIPNRLIIPFKRLARHLKYNFVSDKYLKNYINENNE